MVHSRCQLENRNGYTRTCLLTSKTQSKYCIGNVNSLAQENKEGKTEMTISSSIQYYYTFCNDWNDQMYVK